MTGPILYVVILLAVTVALAYLTQRRSGSKHRATEADLEAFADAHGLTKSAPTKPVQTLGLHALSRGGSTQHPMQYLSAPGSKNVVFTYLAFSSGEGTGQGRDDICALVELPFSAPPTRLSTKRPDHSARHGKPQKITTGNAAFDEHFWLTSPAAAAAQRIFTPAVAGEIADRFVRWPGVEIEMNARHLVAVCKAPMLAAERWALLQWAEDVAEVLGRHHEVT